MTININSYMQKFRKLLVYSLFISILFLILITVFTVGPETIPALLEMEPAFLIAAMALHICSFFLWGYRMKIMAGALGYNISLKESVEAVLSNLFAAAVTPSMIGGEPVRIHQLARNNDISVGYASAVVIGERVLDALFLLILTPFALWVLKSSLTSWKMDVVMIGAEVFVIFLVIFAFAGLLNPRFIDRLSSLITAALHRLGKFDRTEHIIVSMDRELWDFHNSLWTFIKKGRRGLLLGGICTIAYWVVEFLILPLILIGLNQPPSLLVAFAVQVFLTFIMVLPITPGASGIAELGGAALFGIFVPFSILGIVVVIWRAIIYYLNLIIGGFASMKAINDLNLSQE